MLSRSTHRCLPDGGTEEAVMRTQALILDDVDSASNQQFRRALGKNPHSSRRSRGSSPARMRSPQESERGFATCSARNRSAHLRSASRPARKSRSRALDAANREAHERARPRSSIPANRKFPAAARIGYRVTAAPRSFGCTYRTPLPLGSLINPQIQTDSISKNSSFSLDAVIHRVA